MIAPSQARCIRVALGLSADELGVRLGLASRIVWEGKYSSVRTPGVTVLRCEDGDEEPPSWRMWEAALDAELARVVEANPLRWQDIRIPGVETARIARAAGHTPAEWRRDRPITLLVPARNEEEADMPPGPGKPVRDIAASSAAPVGGSPLGQRANDFGASADW